MDFFGLDIGFYKIKAAKIIYKDGVYILTHIGSSLTPPGVLGSDKPEHQKILAEAIKTAILDADISDKKVVIALPEVSVTSRLELDFPKLSELELREAISIEAKKYISYPLDQMQLDQIIIKERKVNNSDKLDIFWVATSRSTVDRYLNIAKFAGLEVIALETETLALSRVSHNFIKYNYPEYQDKTAVIIDIGANGTDIAIESHGIVLSSQGLGTGSDVMTRSISTTFNINITKSDEVKKVYGLDPKFIDGKILKLLSPIIKIIMDEVSRNITYFRNRLPEAAPQICILAGETAQMPAIVQESQKYLNLPTVALDAFKSLKLDKRLAPVLATQSGFSYSVAIGLAMKHEE